MAVKRACDRQDALWKDQGHNYNYTVSAAFKHFQTVREPPPADDGQADCFDTSTKANTLHYFKTYTYAGCYKECKAAFVINRCGCRDLLQEREFIKL